MINGPNLCRLYCTENRTMTVRHDKKKKKNYFLDCSVSRRRRRRQKQKVVYCLWVGYSNDKSSLKKNDSKKYLIGFMIICMISVNKNCSQTENKRRKK